MKRVCILLVCLISLFTFLGCEFSKSIPINTFSEEQKLKDFNYIYNIIENKYPYTEILKGNFNNDILAKKTYYEKKIINSKSDEEFFYIINEILQNLQDKHTMLWDKKDYISLKEYYSELNSAYSDILNDLEVKNAYSKLNSDPIYLLNRKVLNLPIKYVDGNYYFVFCNNHKNKLSIPERSKIISIDGYDSIDDYIIDNLSTNSYSYDYINKKYYLNFSKVIIDKNINNIKIKYLFENKDYEISLPIDDYLVSNDNITGNNFTWSIIDNSIGYIKIKSFFNYDLDKNEIEKAFSNFADKNNIIIDIRGNFGGINLYWKNILKFFLAGEYTHKVLGVLKDYPPNHMDNVIINDKADLEKYKENKFYYYLEFQSDFKPTHNNTTNKNIYLLVNENCYSAAESFAEFIKNNKVGVLVGRPTGGNLFSAYLDKLPNSNLIFQYSAVLEINIDNQPIIIEPTKPDILVKENLEDTIKYCKNNNIENDTILKTLLEVLRNGGTN